MRKKYELITWEEQKDFTVGWANRRDKALYGHLTSTEADLP